MFDLVRIVLVQRYRIAFNANQNSVIARLAHAALRLPLGFWMVLLQSTLVYLRGLVCCCLPKYTLLPRVLLIISRSVLNEVEELG
jgi:hypothetical protein